MYIPESFAWRDSDEIAAFIRAHSFGILISQSGGEFAAAHLPFLYDPRAGWLLGHMARANPQWRELDGAPALAVFTGPHAYISPSWYEEAGAVPTWNYVAVHVYGTCELMTDEAGIRGLLSDAVRFYEPASELAGRLGEPAYARLQNGIAAFRLRIDRVEGKRKLGQNRSREDQRRMAAALAASPDDGARRLARLMRGERGGGEDPPTAAGGEDGGAT